MNPCLSSHTLSKHPANQLITSGPGPPLFGVRRDLIRVTGGNCTLPAIRIWKTTPLTAPRQRLHPARPRSAAPATALNSSCVSCNQERAKSLRHLITRKQFLQISTLLSRVLQQYRTIPIDHPSIFSQPHPPSLPARRLARHASN